MNFDTVLDAKRIAILSNLKHIPPHFYLAGGTGLALQLGHRKSYDFDFFTTNEFDTQQLYFELEKSIFPEASLKITQDSKNSLDILWNSCVKISFIRYAYPLVFPLIKNQYFPIADFRDIGAMKIIACLRRSTCRDYYDIYYLLKQLSLHELFEICLKKYAGFNPLIYLKALNYFEECDQEMPQLIQEVSFQEVKDKLSQESISLIAHYRK